MKRTYVKPAVYVESFTLTQNIALSCAGVDSNGNDFGTKNFNGPSVCEWRLYGFEEEPLFGSGNGECSITEIDGFCYNNPEGGIVLFGS